jgi:ABC-2 type transport system permease protein
MAIASALQSNETPRAVRFGDTLASEWMKLTSLRSTYITLGLGLILSIGMSALVSLAVGSTFDDWNAEDQAEFEPIMFSMVGIVLGGIVYAVFGVMAVTGEYASRMIRLTLTATPRRGRVLAAKVILVTVLMLIFGLLTMVGMFLVGQAILDSYGMPTAALGDSDAQRAVFGLAALAPLFPVIGLALGVLLRSTASAITAVLAIIWLPEIFGGLLPMWWRENVLSLLPGPAADSIASGHITDSPMYSDPLLGGAVTVIWLVLFLGAAYLRLQKQDA